MFRMAQRRYRLQDLPPFSLLPCRPTTPVSATANFEALQPFLIYVIYESTASGDIHLSRYGHSRYSDTRQIACCFHLGFETSQPLELKRRGASMPERRPENDSMSISKSVVSRTRGFEREMSRVLHRSPVRNCTAGMARHGCHPCSLLP